VIFAPSFKPEFEIPRVRPSVWSHLQLPSTPRHTQSKPTPNNNLNAISPKIHLLYLIPNGPSWRQNPLNPSLGTDPVTPTLHPSNVSINYESNHPQINHTYHRSASHPVPVVKFTFSTSVNPDTNSFAFEYASSHPKPPAAHGEGNPAGFGAVAAEATLATKPAAVAKMKCLIVASTSPHSSFRFEFSFPCTSCSALDRVAPRASAQFDPAGQTEFTSPVRSVRRKSRKGKPNKNLNLKKGLKSQKPPSANRMAEETTTGYPTKPHFSARPQDVGIYTLPWLPTGRAISPRPHPAPSRE